MDPNMPASPTNPTDIKPSFKKPSNEAANRKYRRHSPDGAPHSSSPHGSPKRQRSPSLLNAREDRHMIPDGKRRKDAEKEREELSRNHSSRGHDSEKYSDRQSYGRSEDYRRRDDRSRYDRHGDNDERSYRPYRSGRDSRNDSHSDYAKGDRITSRVRDSWRTADSNFKDKGESNDYRTKHRERDYEKPGAGSRQIGSDRDSGKFREQDQRREKEYRTDRRDHNKSPGKRNDHVASHDEPRGDGKDATRNREGDSPSRRRSERSSFKDAPGEDHIQKREEHDDLEGYRNKEKHDSGEHGLSRSKRTNFSDKPNSPNKLEDKEGVQSVNLITDKAEDVKNVDQAKVAALKAAELVNKNLVGFGGSSLLSTDQKKKLLWGSKKNSTPEESSNRWDLNLFSDRDRQEKFNKLMGVKGNVAVEKQPEHKDGDIEVKKREELEMDLEKQYTAGLRRRDGRTVGLGL